MTKAIEILKRYCSIPYGTESFEAEIKPAYDLAIEALEEKETRQCKNCKFADKTRRNMVEKRYFPDILFCRNFDWTGDEPIACYGDDFCSRFELKK